ncbi:MAG TPA: methyl-accepting chemotaxis protein, partial [Candidatus Competibacter sp.]|nr:methyl-accepting chemotaxis protein [Candidatus Competibacter sp.]
MFKNLKLRTQLNIGFILIISFLIVVAGTGYWGLQSAFNGFVDYRTIGRNNNRISSFDASMLNARLSVQKYIMSENEEHIKNYQELSGRMHDQLKNLKETISTDQVKSVESIEELVNNYDSNFKQTVTLINQRNETIKTMVGLGLKMQDLTTTIVKKAVSDKNIELVELAGKVQSQVLMGRYALLKYVRSRLRSDYDKGKELITDQLEVIEDQMDEKAGETYKGFLEEFEKTHGLYLEGLTKLLEITESVDDVTNNALHKIGESITKSTDQIQNQYRAIQDTLGPRVQNSNVLAVRVVTWLSIGAVFLGIALSWLLVRLIRRPIGGEPADMAALTQQVAQGDLTVRFENTGKETGIYSAIRDMAAQLKEMVTTITQSTARVNAAAAEIARGSSDLSQRTE